MANSRERRLGTRQHEESQVRQSAQGGSGPSGLSCNTSRIVRARGTRAGTVTTGERCSPQHARRYTLPSRCSPAVGPRYACASRCLLYHSSRMRTASRLIRVCDTSRSVSCRRASLARPICRTGAGSADVPLRRWCRCLLTPCRVSHRTACRTSQEERGTIARHAPESVAAQQARTEPGRDVQEGLSSRGQSALVRAPGS